MKGATSYTHNSYLLTYVHVSEAKLTNPDSDGAVASMTHRMQCLRSSVS